jgi:hypothetical protein
MHRIDSPGATIANLFTEGNPSLSIPATEVSDDWLNDVQEEIANLIENQGITLVKGTQSQLEAAINAMIGAGGGQNKLDPLLNNTSNQDITGVVFNKATYKAAVMYFDVHRQTDSSNVQEIGVLTVTHDPADDVWRSSYTSNLDDSGIDFNITSGGQVQISTNDLAGASYDGQVRITGITRFNQ